ncbi:hypothetical protein O3Q52_11725 [Streptomyces sp. ActVer]|uniref:hypothetical protein n=1 Tax=Streptomyces sp. ActVer TaxID=3014558 RepID=UPI0022B54191|nr:hypothetical protein [Streptomyces sp. ActVer]MCZ4508861.1 hypothetical protein [Streptomyces sp. ActVer]
MKRPAVRMCARCHRTTSHPVLVHEVRAATGPGFNVYACSECADLYPPMTDVRERPRTTPDSSRRSSLTLRVYTVNADGAVTGDRGKAEVRTAGRGDPLPHTSAYPPCRCPRCRTQEQCTTQET